MVLAPDICSVSPDLFLPHLSRDRVIAELGADVGNTGQRLIQTIPKYRDTAIYHQLYLPLNWCPDRFYPVLIEYAGNGSYQNEYGDHCSGLLEDSKLGYGISAGYDFIWLCLPYLNQLGTANIRRWWGDPPNYDPTRTLDYCQWAVDWACQRYGGDPDGLILTGFSRGALPATIWDCTMIESLNSGGPLLFTVTTMVWLKVGDTPQPTVTLPFSG